MGRRHCITCRSRLSLRRPYYASYGYADPCLQQQEVYDAYGRIVLRTVRVC